MTDAVTGRDLVHQLWVAAAARGADLNAFIRPLTSDPGKFVGQLREARRPKPATIERVRALIEGRELPPSHNQPKVAYSTCTRAERERLGLAPSARQLRDEDQLIRRLNERDMVEYRRALAEAAATARRPGETLHAAVQRVAAEIRA